MDPDMDRNRYLAWKMKSRNPPGDRSLLSVQGLSGVPGLADPEDLR
jgi:hypothetical protein